MKYLTHHHLPAGFLSLCLLVTVSGQNLAGELDQGEKKLSDSHHQSAQSQQRINMVDAEIRNSRAEFLANERTSDVTEAYNRQISRLIESQQQELADLKEQLSSIQETELAMLPMLNRMVDTLARFIRDDLPFLQEERQQRLEKLQTLLLRADASVAEKYRQVLEAYLVEVQYGRTLEAYTGMLEDAGNERQVNFLRLGRTALYYQTLNGRQSGLWLPAQQRWEELNESQNLAIRKALQIARQQQVPQLIDLPLPAIKPHS